MAVLCPLNRKRMAQRIIMGRAGEARQRLKNRTGQVYCGEARPRGWLPPAFTGGKAGEWNRNGTIFHNSDGMILPMETEGWRTAPGKS